MKINDRTRYPHPVLSGDTRDFLDSDFEIEFSVIEDPITCQLNLKPEVSIDQDTILRLLEEGKIAVAVDVRCGDTYYSDIHIIRVREPEIAFPPGILSGRVALRPLLVIKEAFELGASSEMDHEYEGASFDLSPGDLIGWGQEIVLNVGREKLAPMESIFALAEDESLEDGRISIDPGAEGGKINILANRKTLAHIHYMRDDFQNRQVILNSVYLPAIIQLLGYLSKDDNCFSGRDWFPVFQAKCDFYGIKFSETVPLEAAQQLLKNPYERIQENFHGY